MTIKWQGCLYQCPDKRRMFAYLEKIWRMLKSSSQNLTNKFKCQQITLVSASLHAKWNCLSTSEFSGSKDILYQIYVAFPVSGISKFGFSVKKHYPYLEATSSLAIHRFLSWFRCWPCGHGNCTWFNCPKYTLPWHWVPPCTSISDAHFSRWVVL